MGTPTLSVIIPNYNHAQYIGEALSAITKQSHRPLEVIVCDDCSTDNSVEIIRQFIERYSFVQLVHNEKNMGIAFTANRLFQLARGDYIYGCAADDKALPGFFEKSMDLLSQHPQAGLCCSDYNIFYEQEGVIQKGRLYLSNKPRYLSAEEFFRFMRKKFNSPIISFTSVIKKTALISAGYFRPELKWSTDYFTLLVIGFRCGVCYIPEPLVTFRMGANNYSSGYRRWRDQLAVLKNMLRILESPDYSDVRPRFQITAALSVYPFQVLRAVLTDRKHRDYLFKSRLFYHVLLYGIKKIFYPLLTLFSVKSLYLRLRVKKLSDRQNDI